MRRGNRTKRIVALLTVALALNAFAFAPAAQQEELVNEELELVQNFTEIPNETAEEISEPDAEEPQEIEAAEDADEVFALEVGDVSLQAADDVGQTVLPGKVIKYGGKMYEVKGSNYVSRGGADGTFEVNPGDGLLGTERTDNIIMDGSISYNWTTDEAHSGERSLAIWGAGGHFIWRHAFSSDKLYVYSMWFKFDDGANLSNGDRHIAGAIDVETGSMHYNELGRVTDITGGWQQDLCVFRGSNDDKFVYYTPANDSRIYIDDFVVYEVEEITPFEITSYRLEDYDWNVYDEIPGPGEYYHYINYVSSVDEERDVTLVFAMFKDGKLESITTESVRIEAATLANGVLTKRRNSVMHKFVIPEGRDVSNLSYMAYLVENNDPFEIMGDVSDNNPAVVAGAK
ncbi:MAG: hypothetical protein ACI4SS_01910 [Clostridia bacterium]